MGELGKNYTKPDDDNHQDKPESWLGSALVFARAISLILSEGEGVVVKLQGDMKQIIDNKSGMVIVYNGLDGMSHVIDYDGPLKEGERVVIVK